jgi:hypothetical protein
MNLNEAWLRGVCRRTDQILWKSYATSCSPETPDGACKLLFPLRAADRRVSEQEARFAFVLALAEQPANGIMFAPENPTRGKYRFKRAGEGTRVASGRTDISLYDCCNTTLPALNIEFKASGRSGNASGSEDIRKDMAKLVAEGAGAVAVDGMWFHLLRSTNNSSINGLLKALWQELVHLSDREVLRGYTDPQDPAVPRLKRIAFHICVINPLMTASVHRVLDYDPTAVPEDFFKLRYRAQRDGLDIEEGQGWDVHRG